MDGNHSGFFTVVLAFTHFQIKRDVITPIIGIALFAAGSVDVFHTLAADRLITATADNQNLIPFTWAISRTFNAIILITALGLLFFVWKYRSGSPVRHSLKLVLLVAILIGGAAYGIIRYCATSAQLPETMFPDSLVTRPWDILPLVVYVLAGTLIYSNFARRVPSYFTIALWLSVIPDAATQLHMSFGSTALFDNHFNIAHFLKIIAYMVPCGGLILDYVETYRESDRAKVSLAQRAAELERSNADLEQFAYVASHDLQEPLRMVSSYTQLLAEEYKGRLDGEADKYISYTVEGAQRMQQLIRDLLAYSRIDNRGGRFSPTDCKNVLGNAIQNLQVSIEEVSGRVIHNGLPIVIADPAQIGQVFQNLIGNALKFRGKDPPQIHVTAERLGSEWRFSVRDNGIGIDKGFSERVFQIFQRLHTRKEYPGTGIGLAVCKRIIDRHRGRIWVESTLGEGATFFFTIPDGCYKGETDD